MRQLEEIISIALIQYHACMQDINRCLYIAGIRDGKKADEIGMKHVMETINIISRVTGKDPKEILKEIEAKG